MPQWIDFTELRRKISFRDVLEAYCVEFTVKGEQAHARCPLPTHSRDKRSLSFSANLKRGIWQCFGCGARGNVLDFAVRMDGLIPNNTADIRKTALWLDERFDLGCVSNGPKTPVQNRPASASTQPPSKQAPTAPTSASLRRINEPLDFILKGLDEHHPHLLDRGFLPSTVNHFGVGYCARGLMAQRIVIPLHNDKGQLVGYAGRVVDDAAITVENPKYRFPSERERNGVTLQFHKSHLVYNIHRANASVNVLVVVAGFASVWWLHQAGYPNVVAMMGFTCSPAQKAIMLTRTTPATRIVVMPRGDGAGERLAQSVFAALGSSRWVRWAKLPNGKRPTDLDDHALSTLIHV